MRRGKSMAVAAVVAALVTVVAGGCIGTTGRDDFEQTIRERGGGFVAELPSEAVDAVAAELGVEDFDVRSVNLTPASEQVVLDVRDPAAPDNLDTYTVRRGEIVSVEPVRLSAGDDLARDTFPVSQLAFDRLEEMVDTALAEFDPRTGYPTSLRAYQVGEGEIVFSLGLESPRASATAEFTAAGELVEVVRS